MLLDTHVWLWALFEPRQLSPLLTRELEDPANELWLSPVSVWEALLLAERGRLEIEGDPATWARHALGTLTVRDAPLTREVAIVSRELDLPHEDPADRFIAASAVVHGLTLVTADRRLAESSAYDLLADG